MVAGAAWGDAAKAGEGIREMVGDAKEGEFGLAGESGVGGWLGSDAPFFFMPAHVKTPCNPTQPPSNPTHPGRPREVATDEKKAPPAKNDRGE